MAHEIEYRILGDDLQFVEILLDPGETVVSEAGGMMYMSGAIKMDSQFGAAAGGGMFNKLLSAGKRFMTGESLFLATFTHSGSKGK
ncbi:MAG: AIM24 family protein, partial [Bdellovibrionales bacterium]|nr:AIM24 family protein [Bdellovibrionales bacterium]